MYWIEMHVLGGISANIEIGFSAGFTEKPQDDLFNPFSDPIFTNGELYSRDEENRSSYE